MSSLQHRTKKELSFRTRLWIYIVLWVFTGIAFAVTMHFIPQEGHLPTKPEWLYGFRENFLAVLSAPLEIIWAFALASGDIIAIPIIVYLGLHAYFSLAFRRRSLFILLCCVHILVTAAAIASVVNWMHSAQP
jgi:hypothetical protein